MDSPLISIITPFKDTHSFLSQMIDSVITQTYLHWELIIVDDHSSQASVDWIAKQTRIHPRIHLVRNPGNGIIPALQFGYACSKGQYITRMDSDDLMHPRKLEVMVGQLKIAGLGHIALGRVKYISEATLGPGFTKYEHWINELISGGNNFDELYKECVIPSPCWMVHRLDFDRCKAFHPDTYPEDYDLAFRFFESGLKCIPSTQILHYWRDYPHRTSRTDPHYADNTFIDLKLSYFLKLHRVRNTPLVIWGGGRKGKRISRALIAQGIPFHWVCDNPKKIGKKIYGQTMLPFKDIVQFKDAQNIITVSNPHAQIQINSFFVDLQKKRMIDFFFFC